MRQEEKQKAIIVGVNVDYRENFLKLMDELENLTLACDIEVVGREYQNLIEINKPLYVGKGKAEEIAQKAEALDVDYVIFNNELSGSQLRNLSKIIKCEVLDRTTLILEIFSRRARTKEAKLQVEVARLEYMLPRLVGLHSSLGRQGGGSGSGFFNKGSGEKKIELDRRRIEEKLTDLRRAVEDVDFDGETVFRTDSAGQITLKDLANRVMCNNGKALEVVETRSSEISPPPFMVGIAEIELDKETGHYDLVDYVAVVDCGTSLNPNLTRVQTEGGLGQGIGMAMFEDVTRSRQGRVYENSFMQYKLPSRMDIGRLRVEFESSYEATGPFGAKSIGEIVINTPSPAIAGAIANATGGVHIRELPITAEKVFKGMGKLETDGAM